MGAGGQRTLRGIHPEAGKKGFDYAKMCTKKCHTELLEDVRRFNQKCKENKLNVTIINFLNELFKNGHRIIVHSIVNNNSIIIIIKHFVLSKAIL